MSISESEIQSSSHSVAVLPVDTVRRTGGAYLRGALFCPNIAGLPALQRQKADDLLQGLQEALMAERMEAFNTAKRTLVSLLKKYGEPVTQWNPLVLEVFQPDCLRGRNLAGINLERTRLAAVTGDVPVSMEGTSLRNAACLCADFSQVLFERADLSGADLRFVDIREGNLRHATLRKANLEQTKLSMADLRNADLRDARLNGALLKQTNLRDSNLEKADLRHADCYQADLSGANIRQADLRETNLFMAELAGAQLQQADLRGANMGFARMEAAALQHARLAGLNLNNADLTLADLSRCCLSDVLMSRVTLKNTMLSAAELQGLDLSDCSALETARLAGAIYNQKTLFPKGFKIKKHGLIRQSCGMLSQLSAGAAFALKRFRNPSTHAR